MESILSVSPSAPSLGRMSISEVEAIAIADRLRAWTGIRLDSGKTELLRRRLTRRMREVGLTKVKQYLALVDESRQERENFINLLTTNETQFFRTARVWSYLESEFLPAWQPPVKRSLRIWSAACSSGEEVYSLAMLCADWQERHPLFDYALWASDIDSERVAQSRAAQYSGRAEAFLRERRPGWAERFATPGPSGITVLPKLKARADFRVHNLLQPWTGPKDMDLVLLRNVLIYFADPEFLQTLCHVWDAMAPQAVLILGESESLSHQKENLRARGKHFAYLAPQIYRKVLSPASSDDSHA